MVGKIKYVESIASLLMPFLTLGLSQAFVNFLPILEDYHGKTLYGVSLGLVFFISSAAVVLLIIVNLFIPISQFNYIFYGLIISFSLSFLEIMKSRAITIDKVTVPVLFEKISPKIFLIILLVVFGKLTIDNQVFLKYYSLFYVIVVLYIFSYLNKFSRPRFSLKTEHLFENFNKKDLLNYMFFSILASSMSFAAFKLDGIIIPIYLSMKANGLFAIALLISNIVALPAGAIFALNSANVSYLIKNEDFEKLNSIYKEVAKIIFYKCFIVLSIIICVIPPIIYHFYGTNADYIGLIPLIQVLGIGSLFSVATGFNNEIIIFSKYYKYNYLFTAILVVINISLFYYFLTFTDLKLLGIAIAISTSTILFNTMKLIFIKIKLNLLPIDKNYIALILLMSLVLVFACLLPSTNNLAINCSLKILLIFGLNFLVKKFLKLNSASKIL